MAVVMLFLLAGWLLHHFAVVRDAMLPAFVLGMIVANFVPATRGCAVPPRRPPQ
ncbi:MAG: hypothetical protein JNN13_01685 [Planctomycetes bacterium]|nr:hypothetical protein [Planctomycetota bacterium]